MKKILKKIWSKRLFRLSLFSLIILLISGELFARFYLGLGSLPLYREDHDYEYVMLAHQDLYRFGNHIQTNALGMRSKKIKKGKKKILLIGDSVINGGAHVDQDNLCSSQLDEALPSYQVLNLSAGSWGPDNAFAFIQKHGDFDSKLMVLVFSSHDAYDNMHFKKVVGKHPMWPNKQPLCALTDGWSRYAWPKIKVFFGGEDETYDYLIGFDDSRFNSGWENFKSYCEKKGIKLLVYVHPETEERKKGAYNKKGKTLIHWLQRNELNFISGLEKPFENSCYRDNIHLNAKGQKRLFNILYPEIEMLLSEPAKKLNPTN